MLFNSYIFIFVFLPIVVAVFLFLGKVGSKKVQLCWLVIASLAFYGWWNPEYLPLIIGSILINYWLGSYLDGDAPIRLRKRVLIGGITANLALLGYYKYAAFLVSTLNMAAGLQLTLPHIVLPIGISFFTFTQVAYLVDAFAGKTRDHSLLDYSLFVTFFPHEIAGPIVHHGEIIPQFTDPKARVKSMDFTVGLTIFILGLAKKVLLADNFATMATPVFGAASSGAGFNFADAWLGALSYTFQLYFDFSGYSDMAIGLSRLFGVRMPLNFHSPYKADSLIEFWRRWHITLSRFLREYLYVPLGGNRKGRARRYINLMTTMLLGGLWHGAGWNYVIWGGIHGVGLVINHGWRAHKERGARLLKPDGFADAVFSRLLTFALVIVAWVFFKAPDVGSALKMLSVMSGREGIEFARGILNARQGLVWSLAGLVIVWGFPNTQEIMHRFRPALNSRAFGVQNLAILKCKWLSWSPTIAWAFVIVFLELLATLSISKTSEFIYYQF